MIRTVQNKTAQQTTYKLFGPLPFLHLTDRFISTPRRPRTRSPNPQSKQQLLPQPRSLPPTNPTADLLCILTFSPPLRLPKSLRRNLIQPIVLDAQFTPASPEV